MRNKANTNIVNVIHYLYYKISHFYIKSLQNSLWRPAVRPGSDHNIGVVPDDEPLHSAGLGGDEGREVVCQLPTDLLQVRHLLPTTLNTNGRQNRRELVTLLAFVSEF